MLILYLLINFWYYAFFLLWHIGSEPTEINPHSLFLFPSAMIKPLFLVRLLASCAPPKGILEPSSLDSPLRKKTYCSPSPLTSNSLSWTLSDFSTFAFSFIVIIILFVCSWVWKVETHSTFSAFKNWIFSCKFLYRASNNTWAIPVHIFLIPSWNRPCSPIAQNYVTLLHA